jgi:sigma-54 specific flagellar transcriptional regulator A
MVDETRILLIDDNERSRHDLETVLSFLGEKTIPATSRNWHSRAGEVVEKPAEIAVTIVAACDFISLEQLLSDLHQWEAGTPFVLVGEQELPDYLDRELRDRITTTLNGGLSYQPLLDALHKAKLFHEHYNRLRDFDGVRDYNMFRSLIGNSNAIQKVRHMMGQVANTEVSVLITGESGTGKEVVARNLHLNSARADKPFVPINCGAIARELLESELFGHEKGAFTGAVASRVGRFELADGGTLFLDEIGDMPLNMQVKLLRVLQERSFERVGGVKTITTNVRILAATHKDLEQMIEQGEFRQDLYYRINVFPIEMPSLRERAQDIPLLLHELISIMEAEQRGSVRFNSSAIASLCRHLWLGNVRELANLVERMAILYPHGIVGINDLPATFRHLSDKEVGKADAGRPDADGMVSSGRVIGDGVTARAVDQQSLLPLNGLDLKEYLANLEKNLIAQALDDSGGVVARAADRLGIRRTTLVEKMRKYKLQKKQSEASTDTGVAADQAASSQESAE